jgi:lipopolysaccharide/colanic/teichoic acid biosynthesis glycosyltransferase
LSTQQVNSTATNEADVEVRLRANEAAYPELNKFTYGVKGAFDRLAAGLILLVLALPIAIISLLIMLTSPGPVLVRQSRVGRFGKSFTAYKFRSMREDAEMLRDQLEQDNSHSAPTIFKVKRDPRVNRFGRLIRRTSIDEIPQLFNVVRGEMSLVGPRPPLPREVMHYQPHHLQRLAATPGMTGLWQIRGRSEIPFEEMVEMDLEYIRTWSLWTDLRIIIKTPFAVIGGRGAW